MEDADVEGVGSFACILRRPSRISHDSSPSAPASASMNCFISLVVRWSTSMKISRAIFWSMLKVGWRVGDDDDDGDVDIVAACAAAAATSAASFACASAPDRVCNSANRCESVSTLNH